MHYHCISVLSVLAALHSGNLAKPLSPRWDDIRTKHSWKTVPENWESVGSPPSGTTIDLYIALKPHRENALIDALYKVSQPGHPRYRAHLSKEQVADLVAPHQNTLELVNSWLEHHGVPSSSASLTLGGNTLMLKDVSVTQANILLSASYQVYRHVEKSETIVRTVGYALPAVLHGHVLTVVPTTSFISPLTQWETSQNRFGKAEAEPVKSSSGQPGTRLSSRVDVKYLTPSFLRWLYGTYSYVPTQPENNMLGIVGFRGDSPGHTDLLAFMRKYRYQATDASYSVERVNGGTYSPVRPDIMANLGIQYAAAMTYPTSLHFYSIGRGVSNTEDWHVSWLRHFLNNPVGRVMTPQTISTPYTFYEDSLSREYSTYVCFLFAQLGARGVSLLSQSGRSGVGDGTCVTADGSVQFRPTFPGSCPYITAVGGTTGYEPEVAASFSGGGFSNHFKRPDYQEPAVSTFFQALGNRHQGRYNKSGRGIPDISAQAIWFPTFLNGAERLFNGTSGSTIVAASVISLLNDYLLSKGQAPLGFLNPWLYGSGFQALWDIASGTNPGCDTDGFPAVDGWDPVTGLGTSDFGAMLRLLPRVPL